MYDGHHNIGMFTSHNGDVLKPEPTLSIPQIFEFRSFETIMKPDDNVSKPIMKPTRKQIKNPKILYFIKLENDPQLT